MGTPASQGTRECLEVRRVWPASPFPRGLGLESRQRGAPQRQVFGLVGQVWLTPRVPTDRRFPILLDQCSLPVVVPTYRCGTALELHQVPCCLARESREPMRLRR